MQMRKRSQYTEEFKREAIRLITEHGYGVTEAARNLEINVQMLGRRKSRIEHQNNGAFVGNGRLSVDQEELHRSRKENQRLRMEREKKEKR